MAITENYDEIARCNRCGFCQVACPIFRSTGHEAGVARGRMAMLRAVIEGRLEWSEELEEPLFACLLCGACTANCFPALPTADLITDARSEYQEKVGRKPLHKTLFKHLLPHPGRLRLAARTAALGKKTGLSHVAKSLGLLRFLGRDFPKAEEIVEAFPDHALREKVKPGDYPGTGEKGRVAYFVGCGMDIMCPQAAEAALRIMQRIGSSVTVLDNGCCGLPAHSYGDTEAAQDLAKKNLEMLAGTDFDAIVTDCSSCAGFLKKYSNLFDDGSSEHASAKALSEKVRDFVEFTGGDEAPVPPTKEKLVVTWHDPCHLVRGQGLAAEPRKVLKSLPGVEFREMPEADWCCGGAGSYALYHYDLSRQVLDRKIDNLEKTGADVLVTSCPACIVHLSYGVRLRKLPIRIRHLSEILSEHQPTQ